VAGDPGLALPYHPADFPYRKLTVGQKRYQAQSCRFGQVLERLNHLFDVRPWDSHLLNINISLYVYQSNGIKCRVGNALAPAGGFWYPARPFSTTPP
jgi:hypothetical protein